MDVPNMTMCVNIRGLISVSLQQTAVFPADVASEMKYFYLPGDFLGERLCCVLIKYVLLMKMYECCSLSVVMIEHFNTSPL